MNCIEFLDFLKKEKDDKDIRGYASWIILCVCREIASCSREKQKPITHLGVSVDLAQDGDIFVSLLDGNVPPIGYSSAEVQMGEKEYDMDESLFSTGLLFYRLLTGRTLFEKYRELEGRLSFTDIDLCDEYAVKSGRESFYDMQDTELSEFSEAVALLTSWDPTKRKSGINSIVNAINDNFQSIILVGNDLEKNEVVLEKIDDCYRIEELEINVEYRPWIREFALGLESEDEDSGYEIGILICEDKSSVPELFCKAGNSKETEITLNVRWNFYDDINNSIPIYKRNANCGYAVSSYLTPECFQYIDVIEMGALPECKEIDLQITFEKLEDNAYRVVCEALGYDDLKVEKEIFVE